MVRPVDRVLKVCLGFEQQNAHPVPMVRPVDRVLKVLGRELGLPLMVAFPWSDPWIGY